MRHALSPQIALASTFLLCALPLVAATLPFALSAQAQGYPPSQRGSTTQSVALTEVAISYGRPVARGRALFGDLVPWDQAWHPGADRSSDISFSHPIQLDGKELAAGEYSLWLIPRARAPWTLIFSRATKVWHRPYPGTEHDALRLEIQPQQGSHMESLAIYLPAVAGDSSELRVHWGTTYIAAKLKAPWRPPAASAAQAGAIHNLPATPSTVAYGHYWSESKPVLTIASGDLVDVETMLTNTPAGLERMGVAPADIPQNLRDIVTQLTGDKRGPGGHILTGPIHVIGADSGDVLEVRIQRIDLPIPYGYNGCSGFIRELCEERGSRLIHMNREAMTAEVAPGITVPLRPFFGSVGVAPPPALGRVSSNPPHQHAGNLDNKELVAGTTLYIPVWVKGALLQLGDGHAAQGDGEVDQTAIETNLTGRIQVIVRKDMKLDWPRIETPTHWITMGTDTSLVVATRIAVRQMVKFLQESQGITQTQAYQASSMAADLRITQLVDGNVGVHMMIAKAYLRRR
jgi:acetamidase/formamidase